MKIWVIAMQEGEWDWYSKSNVAAYVSRDDAEKQLLSYKCHAKAYNARVEEAKFEIAARERELCKKHPNAFGVKERSDAEAYNAFSEDASKEMQTVMDKYDLQGDD